ncbi:hypothetical protein CROQUDRAFT_658099 [Cronartium quercuum f. sp. fusiforme G11]|uniref:Uncharacterized protein n=1 Tax=Cronartium quercuum f. sp. fusiforme G11 TaxID=708437 RepID=A0A9P6NLQ2_9BASI|nr:hypothetical protein CROQUDRAFT_658099 [Cronartium quercuum f. sp. fusiforme G11]
MFKCAVQQPTHGTCFTSTDNTTGVRTGFGHNQAEFGLGGTTTGISAPLSPPLRSQGSAEGTLAFGVGLGDASCGPSEVGPSTW